MSDPEIWLHDTMASQARTRAVPVACAACGEPDIHPAMSCPTCGRMPATARIGNTLGGRYRIDGLIGQGGFGLVYRATHVLLDQPVAVKFLLAEWAKSTELRTRFQREATALARLRHPGIVAVHDFGEEDSDLYIVMELVEGTPLAKVILQQGKVLAEERVVRLLGGVCEVLEVAHGAGIVHRDLKPENVMVVGEGADERVKILDFGLALVQEPGSQRLTKTNAVQGTPVYMSPEQCRGRDVGPKTDVYALGVMLFELLAGVPPFMAEGPMEIMAQHMFVEPPRVKEVGLKREPHPGLEALARAALSKKVEERPSAAEFRARLTEALAGEDDASLLAASVTARLSNAVLTREERALPPRVPSVRPPAESTDQPKERVACGASPAPGWRRCARRCRSTVSSSPRGPRTSSAGPTRPRCARS